MDFHLMREARAEAENYLLTLGLDISSQSLRDAMFSYFNVKHKFIEQKKRKVHFAKHLKKKAEELNLINLIKTIEVKFNSGDDINPYLSKGVLRPNDHDLLLNDWRINHLHVSESKRRPDDYFMERSNYLLFFHLDQDSAYFIDMREHGENQVFAKKELLRIIKANWPDIERKFRFGDYNMKMTHNPSEEEIAYLKQKRIGLLFPTEVDGVTYMPGSGSATSGFSIQAGREMDRFHRELYMIQGYFDNNGDLIKKQLEEKLSKKLTKLDFSVKLRDGMFYIYEKNSNYYFS